MAGRIPIHYSVEELTFIKQRRKLDRRKLHAKFVKVFGRADVSFVNLNALCKRNGWLTGRDGRFEPGCVGITKGLRLGNNPGSARTQFKKGQLPANTKYAGHERINRYGYVEVSINQINPHTGYDRRYVHKHRLLWEQKRGPIPEGMVLKCLGAKANSDPSNWELIPIGMLPRLNNKWGRNYDQAPAELKPTIFAVARLEHRIKEKKRMAGP